MERIILYTIYVIEETAKYWFVYYGILNLKTTSEAKRYVSVFLIMAATVMAYVCFFDMEYSIPLLVNAFLCIYVLVQCSWKIKIVSFMPVFFLISFIDTIIAVLSGYCFGFNPLIILESENQGSMLIQLMPGCVLLGSVAFFRHKKRIDVSRDRKIMCLQYVFFSVGLLCVAMLTAFGSYIVFIGNVWRKSWFKKCFVILVVGVVIVLMFFLVYIKELTKKQNMQKEKILLYEKQNLLQKEYYKMLHENNESLKRFRHDYHHHLFCLNALLQNKRYDEAVTYIRHMVEKEENERATVVYSGNIVVDAVICGVFQNTEIFDIQFEYEGKLKSKLGVEDIDLCTLLANALENAVEACGRYDGKRYVRMKVAMYKSGIFFIICNSCVEKQREKKQRTEKREKENHGYGMQNMIAVTEKYNGNLQYKEEKGEFELKIYLQENEWI